MSNETIIKNITSNIERLREEDFTCLTPEGPSVQRWNNLDNTDIENLIRDTLTTLDEIVRAGLLKEIPFNYLNNINNQLNTILSQLPAIKNLQPNQIKNQHHQILNAFSIINNNLRSSGIYSILKLNPDIEKKALILDEQLNKASKLEIDLKKLSEQVRNLLDPALAGSLSQAFDVRKKQIARQKWFWFLVLIVSILAAIYVTHDIVSFFTEIAKNNNNKNIEFKLIWLVRFFILVPAYFLVGFAIAQYNKERTLEEDYAHKATIAQALPSYSELIVDQKIKDEITSSATNVAFDSPLKIIFKNQQKQELSWNQAKDVIENIKEILPIKNILKS